MPNAVRCLLRLPTAVATEHDNDEAAGRGRRRGRRGRRQRARPMSLIMDELPLTQE